MGPLEQTVQTAVQASPVAGVLLWFVWMNMKKIDQKDKALEAKDADYKEMANKVLVAFEGNTSAIKSFEKTQEQSTAVIKSLNNKVYDVLTKRS